MQLRVCVAIALLTGCCFLPAASADPNSGPGTGVPSKVAAA